MIERLESLLLYSLSTKDIFQLADDIARVYHDDINMTKSAFKHDLCHYVEEKLMDLLMPKGHKQLL